MIDKENLGTFMLLHIIKHYIARPMFFLILSEIYCSNFLRISKVFGYTTQFSAIQINTLCFSYKLTCDCCLFKTLARNVENFEKHTFPFQYAYQNLRFFFVIQLSSVFIYMLRPH